MQLQNEFGKFFYSSLYINLKNNLFNYRLRKLMIAKHLSPFIKSRDFQVQIADIGSGISPVTPLPKKTLFIELEEQAVQHLRKSGLNAVQGDITKLLLEKEQFDIVVCSEVLEHIRDYKSALRESARILNPSGHAVITLPIHNNLWMEDDAFVGHIRRFHPSILHQDLQEAGLSVRIRKPIGSMAERWLTWLTVKLARKQKQEVASSNPIKNYLFKAGNTFLLQVVRIASAFTSEERASIIMFIAQKP